MTTDLIQILINDSAFAAAVGTNTTGKVKAYPVVAPEKEKQPFTTVRKIKTINDSNYNCVSTIDDELYEVTSWDKNFITTEEIHEAARTALESNGVIILDCVDSFDNASDMYCQIGTFKRQRDRV